MLMLATTSIPRAEFLVFFRGGTTPPKANPNAKIAPLNKFVLNSFCTLPVTCHRESGKSP